jgi:hypothetical protein
MCTTVGQTRLRNFFFLGAIEGIMSLMLLFSLPKDPDSNWLFGYSPFRILLIMLAISATVFFFWLAYESSQNSKWAEQILHIASRFVQSEKIFTIAVGFLSIMCIFGILFLFTIYTHAYHSDNPYLLLTVETIYTYLLRLAPFVFWGTALSLQSLMWLYNCELANKEKYHRVICILSFFLIPSLVLVFFVVNYFAPNYYKHITNEDQLVEWLTIVCLGLTGIFSFLMAYQIKDRSDRRFWFYTLFAVACVLFAFEEMSWGQRILEIQSPQFFLEHSDQQEINVHNVLQEWFSFRTKHVAAWVSFVYGFLLPLLALNRKVKILFNRLGIPIPPLVLAPGFFLSAIIMTDLFSGKEEEVGEFCFSVCLLLSMILNFLSKPWYSIDGIKNI